MSTYGVARTSPNTAFAPGAALRTFSVLAHVAESAVLAPARILDRLPCVRRRNRNPLLMAISKASDLFFTCFPSLELPSAAAIIRKNTEVLLIERADGMGFSLPGGLALPGESQESCLAREVLEETGFRIRSATMALQIRKGTYYEVTVEGETRDSSEGKLVWMEPIALPRLPHRWIEEEVVHYLLTSPAIPQSC